VSGSNLHVAWARLFVRALAASGVSHLVVSPGSRSTPLVLAAACEERLTCHVVVDERSAAFFALGQARVTGAPTALLCTSGTAGAHYFPAIIEASASFLPLVVVTADRPWEAYDAASPQTIDQTKLFGAYVRHFAELGLPDASPAAMRAVPRIAAQAVEKAMGPTPGPVHVNARFRKPLEPVAVSPGTARARDAWEDEWDRLMAIGAPRMHAACATSSLPSEAAIAELAAACARTTRGLVVCGPAPAHDAGARRDAVLAFARRAGFPVLAEATSQLRFGGDGRGPVTGAFDAILRDPGARPRLAADLVIEIGAPATSSGYATFLAEQPPARRIVVAAHGWNDPAGGATDIVRGEAAAVFRALAEHLPPGPRSGAFADDFARAEAAVWTAVGEELEEGALTEGRVARDLVLAIPEGGTLVVSNSNPVRDVDTYAPPTKRGITVLHQRGASGIDGLLSGAAGARTVTRGPLALLTGDLAFLHDLGGLAVARATKGPLAIVVVQNGGGRIFEQLPIARATDAATLSRFFVTPEPVDLAHATAAFGVRHCVARTPAELSRALADALVAERPVVVEAIVEPNAAARRARVWSEWPRRLA
jgi:2-succinyl-5-enolpyruvyl-6-hydroxy-3-cyclohexene-1-carboxylate synthase